MKNINIVYLKDHPQHLPQLAKWGYETWGKYNPTSSLQSVEDKMQMHLNDDKLPLTFIALANDQPIGMCSLRITDGILPELTPWIGSLYVNPAYRGKGVGELLIQAALNQAGAMHYPKAYLFAFDHDLTRWYSKLGWKLIGSDRLYEYEVKVMEIKL